MANETNPVPARSDESGGPDTAGLPVAAVVPADEVSTEALRKAESYIEAEEGATNRLVGAAGLVTTGIAVIMSAFHLWAAYDIVPTQELRYIHVAFVLVLSYLLFPVAVRYRNRIRWWDVLAGDRQRRDHRLRALWRGRLHRPRDRPGALGRDPRRRLHRPPARGDAAHHRPDHAGRRHPLHPLRDARAAPAAALDAPRLRLPASRRAPVHHARGHLRRRGRRLGDPDHPVHDLRRLPQPIRRRQVLHRFLARAHGPQAQQCRPGGRAVVVPPRRTVGIGRRDDGDDRHRRGADAGEGRLHAGTPPAGFSRPAGSAPSCRRRCSARPPSSSPSS